MRYGKPSIGERLRALKQAGCGPRAGRAALPAIQRRDHRHRQRRRLRGARRDALAARGADIAALLRRPGLYRRAGAVACRRARRARLRAGAGARVLPRPAASLCRQGRSLRDQCERRCGSCASGSAGRKNASGSPSSRASVAPSGSSPTPTRPSPRSPAGRQAARGDHAGLLRRLPRDARGDRDPRRARSSARTAASSLPPSPVSTTVPMACGCLKTWCAASWPAGPDLGGHQGRLTAPAIAPLGAQRPHISRRGRCEETIDVYRLRLGSRSRSSS